jgi:hypothetical protein
MVSASVSGLSLDLHAIGLAIFTIGRFVASLVCYLGVPGRVVLLVSLLGCLITSSLTMALPVPASGDANGPLACLMLLMFFEGPIFPTVFAMTLRGLGRWTKLVSTGLTVAIIGACVWPTVAWALNQAHFGNVRFAMRSLIALNATMLILVLVINVHPTARRWVDPARCHRLPQDREGKPSLTSRIRIPPVRRGKGGGGSDCPGFIPGVEHVEYLAQDGNASSSGSGHSEKDGRNAT